MTSLAPLDRLIERHDRLAVEAREPAARRATSVTAPIVETDLAAVPQADHGAGKVVQGTRAGQRADRLVSSCRFPPVPRQGQRSSRAGAGSRQGPSVQPPSSGPGSSETRTTGCRAADTLHLRDTAPDALQRTFDDVVDQPVAAAPGSCPGDRRCCRSSATRPRRRAGSAVR